MTVDDIVSVPLTDSMIFEADREAQQLQEKWGRGTRAATSDRDITGSLAHQSIEELLFLADRAFQSGRTIRETHGDRGDIFLDGEVWDVKGTHGQLDQYYFNKQFLVFDKELNGMELKGITHLVFTLVDLPQRVAHVFGAISLNDFLEKSQPVRLKWDNHGIRAYQLKPFRRFVNHV